MYKTIVKIGCVMSILLMITACMDADINSDKAENNKNKTETIDNISTSQVTEIKVKAIACGDSFSLFLDGEGFVWSCGRNEWSILGNETEGNQSAFSKVTGIKDIIAISAGHLHSLALDKNGEVWSWGTNDLGQIGDSTKEDRSTPVKVIELTNIVAVDAAGDTSFALKEDGTVWAWGENMHAQLGSFRDEEEIPKQIHELKDITEIACGGSYGLAVDKDGFVWAWGYGLGNDLGVASGNGKVQKVSESDEVRSKFGNVTDIIDIDCSPAGVIAIKSDNTLWRWGGIRDKIESVLPDRRINKIAAGGYHFLAIDTSGGLWAWGNNSHGQVGNGIAKNEYALPFNIVFEEKVIDIDGGSEFSMALCEDGTVWAWGNNEYGQLGIGSFENKSISTKVILPKK